MVDQVVLTAGHLQEVSAAAPVGSRFTPPYPVEPYIASTKPGDKVAIEGMGLVALDVITAFTIGLGGSYTSEPDGTLRYHPSGREPSLFAFSLSGYPLCAKSIGTADPVGDYEPAICTVAAISALKRGADGGKRQMDARTELLPLVFAEMELCYYARAARTLGGEEAGAQAWRDLTAAWATGHFAAERARYAATYGSFNAERHFFVGDYTDYRDSADYESQVYASVASDVEAAMVPGGASPLKAALETLRALRDTLRLAVEFKGLTLASQIDFQTNLRGRLASLVAGPPAFRSQQLLALIDAGILRLPFGPSPEVRATADGRVTVRSTRLVKPFSLSVDRLVRAHLDVPSVLAAEVGAPG